jgi:hypothetical protein
LLTGKVETHSMPSSLRMRAIPVATSIAMPVLRIFPDVSYSKARFGRIVLAWPSDGANGL